jgi:mRNA interferase HigB
MPKENDMIEPQPLDNIPFWNIIYIYMHVIAKPVLVTFWTKHPDAEDPLQTWFCIMKREVFTDFASLRTILASADYVDGLVVFNIGGNQYCLIADVRYDMEGL